MSLEHSPQRGGRGSRASSSSDEWLRPRDAADYVKSSTSTLAKMRLRGDGPAYSKFGRLVLYARSDLDSFLRARRRASTSAEVEA